MSNSADISEADLVTTEVHFERQMTKDEAQTFLNMLCTKWKLSDPVHKVIARNNLVWYGVKNGTSPHCAFSRSFTVGGIECPYDVLTQHRDKFRHFCRFYADHASRLIMRDDDDSTETRNANVGKYRISANHGKIAFDFSDACKGLNGEEYAVAHNIKVKALKGSDTSSRAAPMSTNEGLPTDAFVNASSTPVAAASVHQY